MMHELILSRFSVSEADALSRLARHPVLLSLPDDADPRGQASLELMALAPGQPAPAMDSAQRALIDWAGARLVIELPGGAVRAWMRVRLGELPIDTLPEPWQAAASGQAFEAFCAALSATGRGKAHCAEQAATIACSHRFLAVLRWTGVDEVVHGLVQVDSLGLLLLASLVDPQASAARTRIDRASLPVHLALVLGQSELPLDRVRRLRSGDVIFMTRAFLSAEQTLMLHLADPQGGGWGIRARLEATNLIILESPIAMPTPDRPENVADDEALLPVADLPVRLSFDVGHRTVTVAELERLQPGEVLALSRPIEAYVTIRANGAPVGRGQLVDIEGRLGVRIDTIGADAAGDPAV